MLYVFENCRDFRRTIPALVYDARRPEDIDTAGEDHIYDETRYFLMSRPIAPRKRSAGPRGLGGLKPCARSAGKSMAEIGNRKERLRDYASFPKISIYRAQRSQQGCSLSLGMLRLAEPPTGRARLRSSLKSPRNPITPFETSRVSTLHPGLYKRL